ncbi:MAG: hypothetical protein JNK05_01700 [Myxococcales bacterium]|nr:hypothetical protein [Myxococcales bacterium]
MKDGKEWAREVERAVLAAEREIAEQNAAFAQDLAEWGTDEMAAQFAAVAKASPGSERKREALPRGAFLRG